MVAVKKTPKKSSVAQIPDDRIRGFRWDEPACYALMRACNDHWDVLRGPDSSGPGSNAAKTQTWEDVAGKFYIK